MKFTFEIDKKFIGDLSVTAIGGSSFPWMVRGEKALSGHEGDTLVVDDKGIHWKSDVMYENLKENETANVSPEHPTAGFVCLKCGIVLEEWRQLLFDGDGECIGRGEYEFKHCPNCGRKVVDYLD